MSYIIDCPSKKKGTYTYKYCLICMLFTYGLFSYNIDCLYKSDGIHTNMPWYVWNSLEGHCPTILIVHLRNNGIPINIAWYVWYSHVGYCPTLLIINLRNNGKPINMAWYVGYLHEGYCPTLLIVHLKKMVNQFIRLDMYNIYMRANLTYY